MCRSRVSVLSSASDVNKLYQKIEYKDYYIYPYLHPDTPFCKSDAYASMREKVINALEECNYRWVSTKGLIDEITDIDLLVNRLNDIGLKINKSSFLRISDLENVDTLTHYLCTQNPFLI